MNIFPSSPESDEHIERAGNKVDSIPLCLQRTDEICPSGRVDIPDNIKEKQRERLCN